MEFLLLLLLVDGGGGGRLNPCTIQEEEEEEGPNTATQHHNQRVNHNTGIIIRLIMLRLSLYKNTRTRTVDSFFDGNATFG